MTSQRCFRAFMSLAIAGLASTVHAQSPVPDRRWTAEFAFGWDNSISGNINSSGVGRLANQAVVVLKNPYDDVYGTGLHLRFGGGYMLDATTELRTTFTFQSLDADLTPLGDLGVSRLYAQYDDYQSFGIDVGVRQYAEITRGVRGYGDGTVGFAFIDELDVELVAPQANFAVDATDFYDKTAAFTLGGNVGLMWQLSDPVGVFSQLGIRYVTGMSEVDDLVGTGLETINDKSSRWTMPFVMGVQARF